MADNDPDMIDFEKFASYMQTLKGDHICPMCLEEQWSLFTPDAITSLSEKDKKIIPTIPGLYYDKDDRKNKPGFLKSESLNLLIMQCKNCGYMKFFNYKKVLMNLKSGDYIRVDKNEEKDGSEEN
ncbi:TPA: hypothetical protein QCI11_003307 [Enterobacter ludwigii]|jgi:hypothetical protein|uniref:hypothetical protein n=1 Tax=Enterobacter cloacae complex TaxID=354276 RepID=UPI0005CFD43B|nr:MULTISPECIES: hypothetical protein [Enterobacter cloacae complex]EKS7197927.1 hypothetical protein [Enterobacter ludwigii]ELV2797437.1 hypothetical protein [Enterobacter ludwigii]MCM2488940.1 hypothetical protein [Enterobacter cloacae]MED5737015.1 hypothetical protein [Enterobacter ludwigii]RTN61073.1 hypothetical protein EKN82_08420 [Enterobacter ludwigii]